MGAKVNAVALSEIDRNLLSRCLARQPRAWEDFVDRFMGLVLHVIDHSTVSRSIRLVPSDREDLVGEVFLAMVKDDFAVLRRFRGEASLATYLTVITRRVVVQRLIHGRHAMHRGNHGAASGDGVAQRAVEMQPANGSVPGQPLSDRDEVARLLEELEGTEAQVVRMYHLEGKSYQEISSLVGMPENSIGPTLSRAREKMRRASVE
jgi:RNA polymerase sigma-70 factor (ECF subfamily)